MSFLFFFLFIQINIIQSNFVLKFRKFMSIKKEQTYSLDLEFVNQRIDNPYKTEIDLGDPSQRMPGFLKTDEFGFFLSNQGCPHSAFYFKGSKDFKYITPKEYFDEGEISNYQISDSIFLQKLNETEDSNETQYINTKIENYLLSVDNSMKGQQCFHVGTQISLKGEEKATSLIDVLNEKKHIKSYYYEFDIIDEDEMNLNIGLNLTEENKTNYKFIKPIRIEESAYFSNQKIGLKFDYISINNYNTSYNMETNAELDISLGCFIGNTDFHEYFKRYLKENDIYVEPKLFEYSYLVYFFEKDFKGFEKIKNFKLIFYHRELNFNFTLDYEDLVLEKRNGYYFMISFEKNSRHTWKLGFPFFNKYKFIFEHDSKLMGFYCPFGCSDSNSNKKIQENNFNIKKFFIILGIIIVAIIILIIGIFIGKKLFEVRKKRANELLDVYEYKEGENNQITDDLEKK